MTSTRTGATSRAASPVVRAASPTVRAASPTAAPPFLGQPPFDGYPYLVTRIGRTPLRHFAVVPAEWPRDRLVDLLRRQADANQLETCLCLGPADAVYVRPPGEPAPATHIPTGIPVLDRLVIAGPLPDSPDLARRHAELVAYADRNGATGHLVGDGLEGGTPATDEDVARLSGTGPDGLPTGLARCGSCGRRARRAPLAPRAGLRRAEPAGRPRPLPVRQPQPLRGLWRDRWRRAPERLVLGRGSGRRLVCRGVLRALAPVSVRLRPRRAGPQSDPLPE